MAPTALLVVSAGSAEAKLTRAATATAAYTSATLNGPTGLTVTKACSTSSTVTLKWTATSSMYAAGYLLTYTQNGAAGTPQTITGQNTTTMTYPITNGASYVVTLAATYRNWTSQTNPITAPFNC